MFQCKCICNSKVSCSENAFENGACNIWAILFRPQPIIRCLIGLSFFITHSHPIRHALLVLVSDVFTLLQPQGWMVAFYAVRLWAVPATHATAMWGTRKMSTALPVTAVEVMAWMSNKIPLFSLYLIIFANPNTDTESPPVYRTCVSNSVSNGCVALTHWDLVTRQRIGSSLVHAMACRLFPQQSLPEPMMT